jgi:hypothetical protein
MLAEARRALPALKADAERPAGKAGVARVIGRRLSTYPPREMSEGAWAAWWADYHDACGDIPEGALEAGMKAWIKAPESDFLPKPGRLRSLALNASTPAAVAYERAKAAVSEPAPPEDKPRASKEAVAKMLAEYRAAVAKRPDAKPAVREPPPPPTDESGLTPIMRERINANG